MTTKFQYSGDQFPYVLMGTPGTAGDPVYLSTGSGLTFKSQAGGTGNSTAFIGILAENTAAGSYGAVTCAGIFQLPKTSTSNKIEIGDLVHIGSASTTESLVGTEAIGTHVGYCAVQSSTSDAFVSVHIKPTLFFTP